MGKIEERYIQEYKWVRDNNNNIDPVYKYLVENDYDLESATTNNRAFRTIFNVLKIDTVVEIGTFHGSSAAYMAQFVKCVHTFDIVDIYQSQIWEKLGLGDKIVFHLVKDKEEIRQILETIKFDFAFIDDNHLYEECKISFNLVKHCGRVLFHDIANDHCMGVSKFIDEIGAKRLGDLGYWSNEDK